MFFSEFSACGGVELLFDGLGVGRASGYEDMKAERCVFSIIFTNPVIVICA